MRLGIVGGLAGLLTLSRSTPCPIGRAHHVASRRCPSQPSLQACRKTIAPPASTCSLNSTDWRQELGELALRCSRGSDRRSSPFNSNRSNPYNTTSRSNRPKLILRMRSRTSLPIRGRPQGSGSSIASKRQNPFDANARQSQLRSDNGYGVKNARTATTEPNEQGTAGPANAPGVACTVTKH